MTCHWSQNSWKLGSTVRTQRVPLCLALISDSSRSCLQINSDFIIHAKINTNKKVVNRHTVVLQKNLAKRVKYFPILGRCEQRWPFLPFPNMTSDRPICFSVGVHEPKRGFPGPKPGKGDSLLTVQPLHLGNLQFVHLGTSSQKSCKAQCEHSPSRPLLPSSLLTVCIGLNPEASHTAWSAPLLLLGGSSDPQQGCLESS